ncbi:hypothetical protein [Paraburkholderia sp. BL25I1N1]|uniref:hypothetical protein n=1 Tax=Paraburkholderia sp. BL25I1N1 TaxID=1938804 RepID=UPI000D074866|nr:hypothetical protein [Paraburkholderia sp. BL25I1N1]PRY04688.1 hypothetical protein B0G73_1113 [Paraburkholderia sp. BL25I1N1]
MNAREPRAAWIYSQESKARIAELGSKVIAGFLAEVPLPDRKKAFACIKTVSGFRPDTELELKEKGKRFVSALAQGPDSNSKSHAAEWAAFSFAWLSWGKHKFQSQFPEPPSEPIVDEHEALVLFLRKLVPEQNVTVCREDVEKLLLFSGFPLTDTTTADVSWIPTRSALEQAKKAARIPAELESLKRQVKSRENEIVDLRDSANAVRAQTENLHRKLGDSLSQISEIKSDFSKLKSAQDSVQSRNSEMARAFEQDVSELERGLSTVAEEWKSRFGDMTEKAEFLTSNLAANQEAVLRLENVVASLQERAATPATSSATHVLAPASATLTRHPDVQYRSHGLATEQSDVTVTSFNDARTALSVITRNLSAIGVRKDDSVLVAATVLTGVVAGQLVQFAGSFAELVLEAVAAALSDSQALFWRVPLGLQDGSETDFVFSQFKKNTSPAGCVAVVGVNKSAFEIYGDRLANAVAKSQLGIRSSLSDIPLLATFVNGSGVLPPGPELCCLGPVIDSDALIWGRANKYATVTTGRLNSASWKELVEPAKTDEDIEQIIRSLPDFSFSTKLWERTARNALLILRRLDKLAGVEHSENFLMHWLLPWARTNGMPMGVLRDLLTRTESSWLDEKVIETVLAQASDANL